MAHLLLPDCNLGPPALPDHAPGLGPASPHASGLLLVAPLSSPHASGLLLVAPASSPHAWGLLLVAPPASPDHASGLMVLASPDHASGLMVLASLAHASGLLLLRLGPPCPLLAAAHFPSHPPRIPSIGKELQVDSYHTRAPWIQLSDHNHIIHIQCFEDICKVQRNRISTLGSVTGIAVEARFFDQCRCPGLHSKIPYLES